MRAAVVTGYRQPLEIHELPKPVPDETGAVLRVAACGICRSDWHLWQEDWTWLGVRVPLPRVPGHEFAGEVVEVGRGVRDFTVGDRVTVPFHLACGHCEYCMTGRGNICQALGFLGVNHDGGYAEFACIPNADVNLVRLPEGVDPAAAAALGCRYMTAYHGLLDQARVRPGEWVAVFGMGGVGLAAVQIAHALGARVVAVSRTAEKLIRARSEGADAIVEAGEQAVAAIRELTGGGAHVSVDALGASVTTVPAILSLRKGGRHLQLGLTGKEDFGLIAMPVDAMVMQELSFLGSIGCPVTTYPGLLSMVASGALNPQGLVDTKVNVDGVNGVLTNMSDFGTTGFAVITSWAPASV
ncbi:MAG: alcohol dehydrogenase catalytic domain-containing protein [Bacteroidales bacterium]